MEYTMHYTFDDVEIGKNVDELWSTCTDYSRPYLGGIIVFRDTIHAIYRIEFDEKNKLCKQWATSNPDDSRLKDVNHIIASVTWDTGEAAVCTCAEGKYMKGKRCDTELGYFIFGNVIKRIPTSEYMKQSNVAQNFAVQATCMI